MASSGVCRAIRARVSSGTLGALLASTAPACCSISMRFTVSDANTPSRTATPAMEAARSKAPTSSATRGSRRRDDLGSADSLHDPIEHLDAEAQVSQRHVLVVAVHAGHLLRREKHGHEAVAGHAVAPEGARVGKAGHDAR